MDGIKQREPDEEDEEDEEEEVEEEEVDVDGYGDLSSLPNDSNHTHTMDRIETRATLLDQQRRQRTTTKAYQQSIRRRLNAVQSIGTQLHIHTYIDTHMHSHTRHTHTYIHIFSFPPLCTHVHVHSLAPLLRYR